jgi:integrase
MKAGKEHRIPLSPRAVEILEAVKAAWARTCLFPADKGGKLSTMAMSMLLRRMKLDVHRARLPFGLPRLGSRMHRLCP